MDNKDKEKSFLEHIRDIDEKERLADEEKQRELNEKRAKEHKLAQEEYNKKLKQERVELMRLKQGLIAEPELVKPEEKLQKIYTPKEKVSNFFYHNKTYVIIGTFVLLLAILFVHDLITAEHSDANVMIISSSPELYLESENLETLFEEYATDYNGDGKVYISVMYTPTDDTATDDPTSYQANITRVIGEVQSNDPVLLIGDKATLEKMDLADFVEDLTERYPDSECVNEYGIVLNETGLKEKLGIESLDDDLLLTVLQISESAKEKVLKKHDNEFAIIDEFMRELG